MFFPAFIPLFLFSSSAVSAYGYQWHPDVYQYCNERISKQIQPISAVDQSSSSVRLSASSLTGDCLHTIGTHICQNTEGSEKVLIRLLSLYEHDLDRLKHLSTSSGGGYNRCSLDIQISKQLDLPVNLEALQTFSGDLTLRLPACLLTSKDGYHIRSTLFHHADREVSLWVPLSQLQSGFMQSLLSDNADMETYRSLTGPQSLHFDGVEMSSDSFDALAEFMRTSPEILKKLSLRGTKMDSIKLRTLSETLNSESMLESLDLSANSALTPTDFSILLEALYHVPNLHELRFDDNRLSSLNIPFLSNLITKRNGKLERLSISRTSKPANFNMEQFVRSLMHKYSNLKWLEWDMNGLGDSGLRHLSEIVCGSTVERLSITSNEITSIGISYLAEAWKNCDETSVKLKELDLSSNFGIGTKGGRFIADALLDSGVILDKLTLKQTHIVNDSLLRPLMRRLYLKHFQTSAFMSKKRSRSDENINEDEEVDSMSSKRRQVDVNSLVSRFGDMEASEIDLDTALDKLTHRYTQNMNIEKKIHQREESSAPRQRPDMSMYNARLKLLEDPEGVLDEVLDDITEFPVPEETLEMIRIVRDLKQCTQELLIY